MSDLEAITEIFSLYEKYGWVLRRVLLSPARKEDAGTLKAILKSDIPIVESSIDAAWFSRPPQAGGVAWEIRYLGDIPFALLENVDEDDPDFENILRGVESRLRDSISAKISA